MEGASGSGNFSCLESVVNQWVLEYFFHLSTEAFKSGRHKDFAEIRDILAVLIQRPFVCMEKNTYILRIMQCLSRIEEGEDPDCTFEEDKIETPLESAVGVLDLMNSEMSLDKDVLKSNKQMLKEAAVVACLKKQQFSKASKILKKYVPYHSGTKQLRRDLLCIIQEKNLSHPLVANFSLSAIKQKMYEMFEKHIDNTPSFLLTVAQKDHMHLNTESKEPQTPNMQLKKRMENASVQNKTPRKETPSTSKTVTPSTSKTVTPSTSKTVTPSTSKTVTPSTSKTVTPRSHHKHATTPPKTVVSQADCGPTYSLSAVRSKFKSLYQDENPDVKFQTLCETDLCRQTTPLQTPSPKIHKNKRPRSPSPKEETLVSKLVRRRRCTVTVNQLVMERDSQPESESEEQSASTVTSSPQNHASSSARRLFTSPGVPKKRMVTRNPILNRVNVSEQDDWSDEEQLFQGKRSRTSKSDDSPTGVRKQKWTIEETEWIKCGVKKYGEGSWAKIQKSYDFQNRTAVMIKDRWRTMKKLSLV
ncbi:telomeric repeat-binding factor 2 isoform X1 [Mixophyes fleayi]|uniref:telomeric repeat-binding factor 2 isoform X1 n=1 Tax=Mixophyes fleayi TaxID=3061075 RepID=UPI003F4E21D8